MSALPRTEDELDDALTTPRSVLVDFAPTLSSPLVILGAGGKMGPTLAVLAQRAARAAGVDLDVLAVSRFSNAAARDWLEARGVRTLSLDLLDRAAFAHLPDAADVIYLVGLKFGTSDDPALTWATNVLVPSWTCERYATSRIAALSSGNVYPLASVDGPGSKETDVLTPLGEYANSCVARERIFDHYARQHGTRLALVRLSYALDLRYGVVHDLARRVWRGEPIDLTTGWFNGLWQGDANEAVLRALDLAASPAYAFNLTGRRASVRATAEALGELLGRAPRFVGAESPTAFLSDTARLRATLGAPPTPMADVVAWTAAWIKSGGPSLGKPTHFETRGGDY
jgi:nucleoside-diphosphate-sugar epimerase